MQEVIEQLLGIIRGVWRKRWYALAVAWLICGLGWTYVHQLPDRYQASARVFVDTQSMLRPLLRGIAVDVDPEQQVRLMTRTLLSRENLEEVARMTDLDLQAVDDAGMEAIVDDLKNRISLAGAGRENLYSIAYHSTDPGLAHRVVQSLLNLFVEGALGEGRGDSDAAQRFLDRQIEEYEARLRAAENRVKEFKRRYVGLLPGTGGDYFARLNTAKQELAAAQLALEEAQRRRDAIEAQLAGETPSFGMFSPGGPETGPSAGARATTVDSRIATLESQLDSLLVRYTEQHPDVVNTRRTIGDLKEQRERELREMAELERAAAEASGGQHRPVEANPVYQQWKILLGETEARVGALQARVKEYSARVAELEKMTDTVPEVEAKLADLNRDYQVTREQYTQLLQRRESARISQQAEESADDIRVRVIDPPREPTSPSGPNRPLFLTAALVVGVGAGLGVAFLLSQLMPTFDSRRALQQAVNVPVLGTVSEIVSVEQHRRVWLEFLAFISLGALLLAVYVGLVTLQILSGS